MINIALLSEEVLGYAAAKNVSTNNAYVLQKERKNNVDLHSQASSNRDQ